MFPRPKGVTIQHDNTSTIKRYKHTTRADYLCGIRAAGGPERGPANIHAAIGGSLKDAIELTEGVVEEEQGHPLLDIGHKGPILWR